MALFIRTHARTIMVYVRKIACKGTKIFTINKIYAVQFAFFCKKSIKMMRISLQLPRLYKIYYSFYDSVLV